MQIPNHNLPQSFSHCQVLTQTDLQREVDDLAGECSSMLALTCPQCKLLLSRYNWDKQVLFERFIPRF
jgi:hypothetical protein